MPKQIDPSVGEVRAASVPADEFAPETFDLAAWIAGVQPVRRRVTIYQLGHLQAIIDELSQAEALAHGSHREQLEARLIELTAQMATSGVTFEVEGRTSTAVQHVADALRAEGVPDEDMDLGLLAAQIVSPPTTIDDLRTLRSVREADVLRLAAAAVEANTRPITLDPRFLPAASD